MPRLSRRRTGRLRCFATGLIYLRIASILGASPSEWDVLVASSSYRSGLEIAGVDRNVALRRLGIAGEPVSIPTTGRVVACASEELHGISDDIDRFALLSVGLPGAPLEPTVDRHRAALLQILSAAIRLPPKDGDAEKVRLLLPVTRGPVLTTGVAGDAKLADRQPTRGRSVLGVTRQVAGQHDSVDVH